MSNVQSAIDRINIVVQTTNTTDYAIHSFDGDSLLMIGSFDLCYYHEIEIRFRGVTFVSIPTFGLTSPKITIAEGIDRKRCNALQLDPTDIVFKITNDPDFQGQVYYAVAENLEIAEGIVYHYDRNDNGERANGTVSSAAQNEAEQSHAPKPDIGRA